jgi:hypothetical protein
LNKDQAIKCSHGRSCQLFYRNDGQITDAQTGMTNIDGKFRVHVASGDKFVQNRNSSEPQGTAMNQLTREFEQQRFMEIAAEYEAGRYEVKLRPATTESLTSCAALNPTSLRLAKGRIRGGTGPNQLQSVACLCVDFMAAIDGEHEPKTSNLPSRPKSCTENRGPLKSY